MSIGMSTVEGSFDLLTFGNGSKTDYPMEISRIGGYVASFAPAQAMLGRCQLYRGAPHPVNALEIERSCQ